MWNKSGVRGHNFGLMHSEHVRVLTTYLHLGCKFKSTFQKRSNAVCTLSLITNQLKITIMHVTIKRDIQSHKAVLLRSGCEVDKLTYACMLTYLFEARVVNLFKFWPSKKYFNKPSYDLHIPPVYWHL